MKLTVAERSKQPFYPTKITNLFGIFKKQLSLNPFSMVEAAERITKLNDWGTEDFLPALKFFCDSINEDKEMHYMGKVVIRETIFQNLIERLQIQATISMNPEILERSIKKPIMIIGEPRAGTTLLHRLLAQDPQFRAALTWELIFPTPAPDPKTYKFDDRIRQTELLLKKIFRTSPALTIAHPMEAKLPDECFILLHRTFIRPLDCLFFNIPKYQDWMLGMKDLSLEEAYGYYRKQLQILQWKFPKTRYVLKSPVHSFFLPSIVVVFPDIHFVHCHRDPKEILPSICSLAASRGATYYSYIDFVKLGKRVMDFGKKRLSRVLDAREKIGPNRFFDISFRQLIRNPISIVKSLYEWLNLRLDPQAETSMQFFLESQHGKKYTKHRYSLDQFGLDRCNIDHTFKPYWDQFFLFLSV